MRTFREAKEMAKALRTEMRAGKGVELTHSECLEIVAREFGFDNWNVLAARIEKEGRGRIVPRFLVDGLDIGDPRRATSTTIPVLAIGDEKRALNYYCDFLGFALDFGGPAGGPAGGPFFGQVIRGETTLRLSEEPGGGGNVTIHIGDVDAVREELSNRRGGVPEVETMFWGYRILDLTDPFGNRLQLSEPLDVDQRAAMPCWVGR
ncbi:glyoxalase superfamily protein [Asanoa siamensis]|uniref:Bleomycin resistance protein n=1 Tax=Asanoa siamensis TaxID=926357 RepID=A0ABQ4CQ10_9ACTN|nr:glyoxalase superfamily protein [Asanoa siamensis]GIF73369.1 glyoxalase [Asanoa siamensis]